MTNVFARGTTAAMITAGLLNLRNPTVTTGVIIQNPAPMLVAGYSAHTSNTTTPSHLIKEVIDKTLGIYYANTVLAKTRVSYENSVELFGEMRNLTSEELADYHSVISKNFIELKNERSFFSLL